MEFQLNYLNPKRWWCESVALNMPANLENSVVATGLDKLSFHFNPKESEKWRWNYKFLSHVQLFATPWTLHSMEFSRPEYSCGWPFPTARDFPNPGIEPRSPTLQVVSLPAKPQGNPRNWGGKPNPSPADLPDSGIEPGSPTLQVDSLPTELPGKPLVGTKKYLVMLHVCLFYTCQECHVMTI